MPPLHNRNPRFPPANATGHPERRNCVTTEKPTGSALAVALAAFQAELPRVGKDNEAVVKSDKGSYKYNFADLADVSHAVMPVLAKHGLSFSAKPTLNADGKFVLEYTLRHVSGESDMGQFPLSSSGNPQQIGSLITYARRYTLSAVTGIVPDGDDDGQAAAEQAHQQPPPPHPADVARAQLKAARRENGWDADRVGALYDGDLATETDAAAIEAFTKSLFARPAADLKAPA